MRLRGCHLPEPGKPHRRRTGTMKEKPHKPIVLFDGDCTLCNGSVRFLLGHERHSILRFASLQSPMGRGIVERAIGPGVQLDSLLVLDGASVLRESDAVLRLASHLRAPWNLLALGVMVPRPLRDGLYRWIARHRRRWFGTANGCSMLREEWKGRFLDIDADRP